MKSLFTLNFDGPEDTETPYVTPYVRAYTLCEERHVEAEVFESLEDVYDYAISIFEHVARDLKRWDLLRPITLAMHDIHTYFVYAEYHEYDDPEKMNLLHEEFVSFRISRYLY